MYSTISSSRSSRLGTRRSGSGSSLRASLSAAAALIFGVAILLQTTHSSVANTPLRESLPGTEAEPREPTLPPSSGVEFGLFGSIQLKASISPYALKWADLKARTERESGVYAACERGELNCNQKVRSWQKGLAALDGRTPLEQIRALNRQINHLVTYRDDQVAFGQKDYWATPMESLNGVGDCEDYAILKFYSLLKLGFSPDQIRLAIVRDTRRRLLHAVTTVDIDGRIYVLDNLFDEPVEHQYVLKYAPSYSANLTEQWVHIVSSEIRAKFVERVQQRLVQRDAVPKVYPQVQSSREARGDVPSPGKERTSAEYWVDPVELRSAWT